MKVLIADDHRENRALLQALLKGEHYETVEARNGEEALAELAQTTEPMVALLDWQMPKIEGPDVCKAARLLPNPPPMFLFLVTVRDSKDDIVAGLRSGANDYIIKPFHKDEMLARVKIGAQMVQLQQSLLDRVRELAEALARVKQLSGLLPICGFCKKVRNDRDYWQQVEEYISIHSEVKFSHGVCPDCYENLLKPQLEQMRRQG
jgi:DNA-binding response OmpR family regulator